MSSYLRGGRTLARYCIRSLATPRPSKTLETVSPRPLSLRFPTRIHSKTLSSATNLAQTTSDEMAEPTGLIAQSGIELLTFGQPPPLLPHPLSHLHWPLLGTPNGHKISVFLEELKEAYGRDYTAQSINISKNTQKQPWYTALNPNGRIPTIVDHDRGGFVVFEGLAILAYLARHYDPEHKFSFPIDSDDYSVCEQWISWQHGGLGPM